MKKWSLLMIATATAVSLTGCFSKEASAPTKPSAPATQIPIESQPTQQQKTAEPASPAEKTSAPAFKEMNEQNAVKLTAEASKRYWHVVSGGKVKEEMKTFKLNGTEYRYLGKDLDSKAKLTAYLQDVYTPTTVEKIIKSLKIVEHEGKMAQPNADGGSLLDWQSAQASLIDQKGDSKSYELQVPIGNGSNVQFEVYEIPMKKQGNVWKVDTMLGKEKSQQ